MEGREHRNPGSQIRALSTDTSLSEVYEVGQFLAEMTKSRPAHREQTVDSRTLFWRNEVAGALLNRGFVRDIRVGADGSELGNVCGAIVVRRESDKAVIVAKETAWDTIAMSEVLTEEAKAWAAKEGLRLGFWETREPVFIEIR